MRIWRRKLHFWDTTLEDDDDDSKYGFIVALTQRCVFIEANMVNLNSCSVTEQVQILMTVRMK